MKLIPLDFETFYGKGYTLKSMLMEDYITDPRFEVMLVGVGDQWCSGSKKKIAEFLAQFDLNNAAILCHNTMFDGLILKHHFGITPKFYFDTAQMAQAVIKPHTGSASLAACLEYCKLGIQKGTAVLKMADRPRASLSASELRDFADYCLTDVDGTLRLFKHLKSMFPREEFLVMDAVTRMYLEPRLQLDANLLAQNLADERAKKVQLINSLGPMGDKKALMSNEKFADLLRMHGVEPPMKVSKTTGKNTYAFAKTDPGFLQLQEDYADHPVVSAIIAARLGVKSTIEETRTERLLNIAQRYGKLRVPLRYYGAHTGRLGGMENINMQNPPRVDKSKMRYAIVAPPGHVVMAADLAQIEARITAWLARQHDLLEQFRLKRDVYSEFAQIAFRKPTVKGRSKDDDRRRFVGKTCILGLGYGMGPEKLGDTLSKDGVKMTPAELTSLVNVYRRTYSNIPQLWSALDFVIPIIAGSGGKQRLPGGIEVRHGCVILPNGMPITYAGLHKTNANVGWTYKYGKETRTLWGGKLTENIVQALARIVVMQNMLEIQQALGLYPVLQVHDELDYVVPAGQAEHYAAKITEIMSRPPQWAKDLPVAVEVHWGPTFGDCK